MGRGVALHERRGCPADGFLPLPPGLDPRDSTPGTRGPCRTGPPLVVVGNSGRAAALCHNNFGTPRLSRGEDVKRDSAPGNSRGTSKTVEARVRDLRTGSRDRQVLIQECIGLDPVPGTCT